MLPQDIFIIPLRLEECAYPERLSRFQGLDWFDADGTARLVKAIQEAAHRRGNASS